MESGCIHQWHAKLDFIPGFGDEICGLCGMQRRDNGTEVINYNPVNIRDRVIKAALAVDNCVAEFGNGNAEVGQHGLEYCGEHFQELHDACYELTRFREDLFMMSQELQNIRGLIAEHPAFSARGSYQLNRISAGISIISEVIERWTNES